MTLQQIRRVGTAEKRLREARDRYMALAEDTNEPWLRRISRSLSIELGTAIGYRSVELGEGASK